TGFGPLISGAVVTPALTTIPPLTVTVTSSNGGSATAPVSIVNPPAAPVAVAETATTVGTTPVVIDVIANDTTAGTIDPTTVTTGTLVNGTTSVNTTTGTVTFTPTAAGAASFTY